MAPSAFKILRGAKPLATLALFGFIWCADNKPAAAEEADQAFVEAAQECALSLRPLSPDEMVRIAAMNRPKASIHVYFNSNSAAMTSRAKSQLKILGKVLSETRFERTVFLLVGYADPVGGDEYNQKLSERRADAVKTYLMTKFKIPAETLATAGKRDLNDPRHPYSAENRRIEVVNLGSSDQAER
jgi:outer membrane protein OmpA-like peptidoglycan-associated protein